MKARHKKMGGTCRATGGAVSTASAPVARKRGGKVEDGKELHMHGAKARFRLDKPGRKRGGRVGSDGAPLSSAGRGDHPHGASDEMGGPRGGEPGYAHGGAAHHKGNMPHHKHMHHRASGGKVEDNEPRAKRNYVPEKGSIADEIESYRKGGAAHEKKKK